MDAAIAHPYSDLIGSDKFSARTYQADYRFLSAKQ
jgi:hypothetical protein